VGIPLLSASFLKYSIVASSMRIEIWRFSFRRYGFFLDAEKSYSRFISDSRIALPPWQLPAALQCVPDPVANQGLAHVSLPPSRAPGS
jgi:hypothetical protein